MANVAACATVCNTCRGAQVISDPFGGNQNVPCPDCHQSQIKPEPVNRVLETLGSLAQQADSDAIGRPGEYTRGIHAGVALGLRRAITVVRDSFCTPTDMAEQDDDGEAA